jgi:hypothetical protein
MSLTTFSGPVSSQNGFIGGTASSPITVTTAQNISSFYASSSATTGDTRLNYSRLDITSTGSGETLRAFTRVSGASAATGGTVNGAHISLSVNSGGTISGAANALRATLGVASGVTPGGTLSAIQVDSDIASGVSVPGTAAFLRFTNSNSTTLANLMNVPAAMIGANTQGAATNSIKIVNSAGTAYYIMLTTVNS